MIVSLKVNGSKTAKVCVLHEAVCVFCLFVCDPVELQPTGTLQPFTEFLNVCVCLREQQAISWRCMSDIAFHK